MTERGKGVGVNPPDASGPTPDLRSGTQTWTASGPGLASVEFGGTSAIFLSVPADGLTTGRIIADGEVLVISATKLSESGITFGQAAAAWSKADEA
jgi:hypothetical protein